MPPVRQLLGAVSLSLLFSLTACVPGQSADERQSDFYVSVSFQGGQSGYLPTGSGWRPNSKVEISVWNEPSGPGSSSTQWKKLFDETVDPSSLFGFNPGAPFYPVPRRICGHPENGQTVVFMAKSLATGNVRMRHVPADLYFTFEPCG